MATTLTTGTCVWLYVLLISRLFQSIVISHFTFHYLLHLGCIGYGGLICRIKEVKVCSLYRPLIWSSRRKVSAICFLYFTLLLKSQQLAVGCLNFYTKNQSSKTRTSEPQKTKSVGCVENSGSHAQPQPPYSRNSNSVREEALCFQFVATDYTDSQQET